MFTLTPTASPLEWLEVSSLVQLVANRVERRDHSELLALAGLGFAEFALNAHAIRCS